jgi:hypothetical protein
VGRSGVGTLGADEVATSLAHPGATAASSDPAGLTKIEVVRLVAAELTSRAPYNIVIFHIIIEYDCHVFSKL